MSSLVSPGMARLRAAVRRLVPLGGNETDPTLDDDGPFGETDPDAPPASTDDPRPA